MELSHVLGASVTEPKGTRIIGLVELNLELTAGPACLRGIVVWMNHKVDEFLILVEGPGCTLPSHKLPIVDEPRALGLAQRLVSPARVFMRVRVQTFVGRSRYAAGNSWDFVLFD